jgi:hypothetical protein
VSRFGGKLVLVLLDNKRQPSIRSGRSLWGLQRELTYQTGDDPAEIITVPAGFVTDLASIPRVVWSFFPPDGPWVKGAVIHDFLYFTQGIGIWYGRHGVSRAEPYSRAEADHILREAMADRGIGAWAQFVIWAAVRLGGAVGWARKHDKPRPKPTAAELQPSKPRAS